MSDFSPSSPEKAFEKLSVTDSSDENKATSSVAINEPVTDESNPQSKAVSSDISATPSSKSPSLSSLYVGELDLSVSEAMLFDFFSQIGPVSSIRVCRDALTKKSLGYAYVNFHNIDDGARALVELNYVPIKGRPCRIMWSQRDPSSRRTGAGNIYIKNLDLGIDNKDLHDTFSTFGKILSCKVATDGFGASKGYGFVHFETTKAAESAIKNVNGMLLNDRRVFVGFHIPKQDRQSIADEIKANFTNIYVKNIDPEITDTEFKNIFQVYGNITSFTLSKDVEGRSRGFGFVNYNDHYSAVKAVEELNDSEIKGKRLYVGRAQKKDEREEELKKQHEAARLEKSRKYSGVNLYIKNLDESVDDEKLREIFSEHGSIASAKVMTDDEGRSKGFGFVCLSSPEDATRAVTEMSQFMVAGKPLYVALAQRKDARRSQLQQQIHQDIKAKQQISLHHQAGNARGMHSGYMHNPMFHGSGQSPGFISSPVPGRNFHDANSQHMMIPPRHDPMTPHHLQWPSHGGQPISANYNMGPIYSFPGGPQVNRSGRRHQGFPGGRGGNRGSNGPINGHHMNVPFSVLVYEAPEEARKQILGDYIFPRVLDHPKVSSPDFASKITGILLEIDIRELVSRIESESDFDICVDSAVAAYQNYLNVTSSSIAIEGPATSTEV